jgi:uncharacterized cupredoxin-like copper-binding protein
LRPWPYHDFTIDDLDASDVHSDGADHGDDDPADDDHNAVDLHVAADPGGTGTLEFTPSEAGEYVFYCTFKDTLMLAWRGC